MAAEPITLNKAHEKSSSEKQTRLVEVSFTKTQYKVVGEISKIEKTTIEELLAEELNASIESSIEGGAVRAFLAEIWKRERAEYQRTRRKSTAAVLVPFTARPDKVKILDLLSEIILKYNPDFLRSLIIVSLLAHLEAQMDAGDTIPKEVAETLCKRWKNACRTELGV